MNNDNTKIKYIALRDGGMEGYSVERFETKEELEKYLSGAYDAQNLEIYQVIPQKLSITASVESQVTKTEGQ